MKRYCDPDAERSAELIHSIEISESHDAKQFVTFWTKGQRLGNEWAERVGLRSFHDPAVYHAGDGNYGWLPKMFPGKQNEGWSTHFHLDTPLPPDISRFADQIPAAILKQLT